MSSPSGSLFRQEVFDAKRSEWLAPVKLAMPLPYRLLAAGSLLACVALFSFLILGRYSRREQAQGQLVPSLGLLAMTVPTSGTRVRIAVREG